MKSVGKLVVIIFFICSSLQAWPSWRGSKNTVKKIEKKKPQKKSVAVKKASVEKKITPTKKPEACIPQHIVRVLLDEKAHDVNWTLYSKEGFYISDPQRAEKTILTTLDAINIRGKNKVWLVNDKLYKYSRIVIRPKNGRVKCNDKEYEGYLIGILDKDCYKLINFIQLERYVFSVLKTESWPGWPLEVNKAFAIASRTYVISMMQTAKLQSALYDVTNTNTHQTYTGVHNKNVLHDAVTQTKGIFLAHNKQPIVAMFDCCCGGLIPAHIEGVDFQKAPYLARNYACTHCKKSKIYSWQAEYPVLELHKKLSSLLKGKGVLKDIKITKKDKAGVVQEVVLKTHKNEEIRVAGKKLYGLLKEVKSFSFSSLLTKGKSIQFKGKGYGHHLGICQWGAREMVRNGWDYRRVLTFYYPGTEFLQLT